MAPGGGAGSVGSGRRNRELLAAQLGIAVDAVRTTQVSIGHALRRVQRDNGNISLLGLVEFHRDINTYMLHPDFRAAIQARRKSAAAAVPISGRHQGAQEETATPDVAVSLIDRGRGHWWPAVPGFGAVCPTQRNQRFLGSHWTVSSGVMAYRLYIAAVAGSVL